jgi:cob(I)alamin adenosyltransferase
MAKELYTLLCTTLQIGGYDLVIADEILVAHTMGLLTTKQIEDLFELKNNHCEFVMTGDTKVSHILEKGDLVTCMAKVKHYYDNGVTARKGIEY